jgi:hypothetical protein
MISYEVSIGLIIIGVILSTGSMNFGAIVNAQDTGYGLFGWYWLPHLPMVVLFFVSALAETNRPPFDLPEAESELVAGYQVEYSSTPFLLFMAGEYIAIFLMCALIAPVLRRLAVAHPGPARRRALDGGEDGAVLLPLRDGEGGRAPLPLRPAHAHRLEGVPAAVARLGGDRGLPREVRSLRRVLRPLGSWEADRRLT